MNWKKLPKVTKEKWEAASRAHDDRHPLIKDVIIESFQSNPAKGFAEVELDIKGWCSQNTIYKWLSGLNGYGTYTKRDHQKTKIATRRFCETSCQSMEHSQDNNTL